MTRLFEHVRRQRWLFLLGAFLLPLLLARPYLTQSLWSDEASSVWFARLQVSTLLTHLCDPHPPGYYLWLKLWLLFGGQEFWLRLPSLLVTLLSAAFIYRLGRDVGSREIGWLTALLLAWHPLQIWYAAEVRMYTAVQLSGLAAFWLGWRFWTRGKIGDGLLYTAAACLALWLDYSAVFAWGLLQLWWLIRQRPRFRSWLVFQTAVILFTLLLTLPNSQTDALGQAYQPIFLAIQARRLGIPLGPEQAAPLLSILGAATAGAALFLAWSWPRGTVRFPKLKQGTDWLIVIGWLVLLVATAVPRLYTIKRLLVVLLPYAALLTAAMLSRWSKRAGLTFASIGLLITLLILPTHSREDWRQALADLASRHNDAAVIWVDDLVVPAFAFYAADDMTWQPLIGADLPDLPPSEPAPGDILFLVTSSNPYRPLNRLLPSAFYANYAFVDLTQTPGVQIFSYRRRLQPAAMVDYPNPTPEEKWGLRLPSPLAKCNVN